MVRKVTRNQTGVSEDERKLQFLTFGWAGEKFFFLPPFIFSVHQSTPKPAIFHNIHSNGKEKGREG